MMALIFPSTSVNFILGPLFLNTLIFSPPPLVLVLVLGVVVSQLGGSRSKAPDKKPTGQKPPDNKPPMAIAKYTVDANLF